MGKGSQRRPGDEKYRDNYDKIFRKDPVKIGNCGDCGAGLYRNVTHYCGHSKDRKPMAEKGCWWDGANHERIDQ